MNPCHCSQHHQKAQSQLQHKIIINCFKLFSVVSLWYVEQVGEDWCQNKNSKHTVRIPYLSTYSSGNFKWNRIFTGPINEILHSTKHTNLPQISFCLCFCFSMWHYLYLTLYSANGKIADECSIGKDPERQDIAEWVIHKSVKHFKNSQQINYSTDHGSSYADRERNSPSSPPPPHRCSMCPPLAIWQISMRQSISFHMRVSISRSTRAIAAVIRLQKSVD